MPEVSLVAIFDADKEGFLRSDRSLIQTMGRAARNINGKAILYADKVTGSMRRAIDETERRRSRQKEYNEKHGIEPESIIKKVMDIMESDQTDPKQEFLIIDDEKILYNEMSQDELIKKINYFEKKMLQAAKDLEFEHAAKLRDQIHKMKDATIGLA